MPHKKDLYGFVFSIDIKDWNDSPSKKRNKDNLERYHRNKAKGPGSSCCSRRPCSHPNDERQSLNAMAGTWRDIARPLIAQVLKDTNGKSDKEIRKALKDAYPWGERAMHPYKIWSDEIRVQRGKRKFNERARDVVMENQTDLF